MDKLKASYERILLAAAGLGLAAASAYVVFGSAALEQDFPAPPVPAQGTPFAANPDLDRLAADLPHLLEPAGKAWGESDSGLFVSRIYLLRDGQLVDILESDKDLVPGLANAWILKHHLDYTDRDLAQADPDGDGFDNSEEFRAGTDPNDAASKPAAWSKLRLASSRIEKLRTKFESLPTGDLEVVQINTVSAENPAALTGVSKFYRRGEAIVLSETGSDGRQVESETPLTFRAAAMVKRFNDKTNSEQEIPSITLVSSVDGREIELLQGEVRDSPYSLASLQDTRAGGKSYDLRSGQEFELEAGQRYKLIDVSEEAATIEDLSSGKQLSIPRLDTDAISSPPSES